MCGCVFTSSLSQPRLAQSSTAQSMHDIAEAETVDCIRHVDIRLTARLMESTPTCSCRCMQLLLEIQLLSMP